MSLDKNAFEKSSKYFYNKSPSEDSNKDERKRAEETKKRKIIRTKWRENNENSLEKKKMVTKTKFERT